METKYPEIPILQAFVRNGKGMLSVWCPYCGEFHHHGSSEGARTAHCKNPRSPFLQTGYILKKIALP